MITKINLPLLLITLLLLGIAMTANAATVLIEESTGGPQTPVFDFPNLPSNSSSDFANGMAFTLLAGTQNANGSLANLTDGDGQVDADEPADSFYSTDASNVRIQIDLGATMTIDQINTYSWHTGVRAPQFYQVYGATAPTNSSPNFTAAAFRDETALGILGYSLIASADTRAFGGGQHAVSIDGTIGDYRYLMFEISRANTTNGVDGTRGTFFGEIDIYTIPEPSALALFGVCGLFMISRRQVQRG